MIQPMPDDPKAQAYCRQCGTQLAACQIATNQQYCDWCADQYDAERYAEYAHDDIE